MNVDHLTHALCPLGFGPAASDLHMAPILQWRKEHESVRDSFAAILIIVPLRLARPRRQGLARFTLPRRLKEAFHALKTRAPELACSRIRWKHPCLCQDRIATLEQKRHQFCGGKSLEREKFSSAQTNTILAFYHRKTENAKRQQMQLARSEPNTSLNIITSIKILMQNLACYSKRERQKPFPFLA
jgi:hypothetical protein